MGSFKHESYKNQLLSNNRFIAFQMVPKNITTEIHDLAIAQPLSIHNPLFTCRISLLVLGDVVSGIFRAFLPDWSVLNDTAMAAD